MSQTTLPANDTFNMTDAMSDDDTDDTGPNLGPCAHFIACVMDATPATQTATIATYGEEGICWDLPGVTEVDCWAECEALLAEMKKAYPDAEACWDCASDDECSDPAPYCFEGTCIAGEPCEQCECKGVCVGTCEMEYPLPCDGVCQGWCTGTCSETDGQGNCNGTCDALCEGTCLMPDGGSCPEACFGTCVS